MLNVECSKNLSVATLKSALVLQRMLMMMDVESREEDDDDVNDDRRKTLRPQRRDDFTHRNILRTMHLH